jgi:lycopene cyclase domain-containing protein
MNFNQGEYLLVLFASSVIPFIYIISHQKFLRKYHLFIFQPGIFIAAIPFILFDMIAVQRGYWEFNPKFITGIHIGNLPIEEYLFFILIPQSCLLIWVALKRYTSVDILKQDIIQHFKKDKP